ncbi:MAG: tetratricopeptide (TPR) repeat protein [Akkermansiaceae bacterium]|jgi:tetratricopeptide (TPR) repeat protein
MEAVKVIVGWFDRYPPGYYQVRLERVLKELETKPDELSLYDDAGVALDRLHRSDEAIAMMARKKATMENLAGSSSKETLWEHRYRHLANLGTFYVHRWIGREKEAREADLSDLAKAEEFIAAAIEHNPNAHFGREKYQLIAIQWLQKGPSQDLDESPIGHIIDPWKLRESEKGIEEALEGFLGMIKLGSAWESSDFFNTIAELNSAERRGVLAHLAHFRSPAETEKTSSEINRSCWNESVNQLQPPFRSTHFRGT